MNKRYRSPNGTRATVTFVCRQCGTTVTKPKRGPTTRPQTLCSKACRAASFQRPIDERFWEKVEKTGTCWLWTGARMGGRFRYGQLNVDGVLYYAHRIMWIATYGDIPSDRQVLHHCDVPHCVRPDHLFLGTQEDNVRDALRKHRMTQIWSKEKPPKPEIHAARHSPEVEARAYRTRRLNKRARILREHLSGGLHQPPMPPNASDRQPSET